MRNTRWIYNDIVDNNILTKYDRDILQILNNRGIQDEKEIEFFLNATIEDMISPQSFAGVELATKRILDAVEKKENIWIYGDYDVDGITSTSLCYLALKKIGANVEYYIPLRDEGYGVNKEALESIKENGGNLVITVDCGISSIDEVEYCKELGMDIIITDHHEIKDRLPNGYAVINPKREDNEIDYKIFAGVGTAFILLLEVYDKLGIKEELYRYLDIVCIGTVADIVPLIGYNRIIVKEGLELLKSSKNLGLNMLLKRIYENPKVKKFDSYDVGFRIAPIFNAAGRLEDAKKAVQLLISESHVECDRLIYELLHQNEERKNIQDNILKQVNEKIEREKISDNSVIVVEGEGYHHGVIGIVASKILDIYYKPTIIMEIKKDEGVAVASCRSVDGFNITEGLNSMGELFVKFGGHAGAAGFTIPIENIDEFKRRINLYRETHMNDGENLKPIKIDSSLSMIKISYDLMRKLEKLEPFGFGNPAPTFLLENCRYKNLRAIGKEKNHLMIDLIQMDSEIKNCVWFNSEDIIEKIVEYRDIDVVFKLKLEIFNSKYQYKIYIEDIKESKNIDRYYEEMKILSQVKFPINSIFYTRANILGKKLRLEVDSEDVYILNGDKEIGYLDIMTKELLKKLKKAYNYNYAISIREIEEKENNFNVFVEIDIDREFKTLEYESGRIFKDIKNYLIGRFEYNSIQKKVLSKIFKGKERVYSVIKKGRGINTILKTIYLYQKVMKNGLKVDSDDGEIIEYRLDSKKEEIKIYIGNNCNNIAEYNLIIGEDVKMDIKNFVLLEDKYEIDKNVVLIEERDIKRYKNIYFREMEISKKLEMIEKIRNNKLTNKLYATKDILVHI